ncbi:RNA polymerase sigma factor [Paenibacillus sp. NPDC058174]|uniref:RNA polymerase sigma factor n=1 Tax=Paenibacillus sp. NPDC058174 TaxID=3346366 RepID=UPI0036DD2C63
MKEAGAAKAAQEDYLATLTSAGPMEIEAIVAKYWSDIWNYAFVLTKKHDLADDVTQDTFVQAFLGLDKFRGQASVKTWLLKICHNVAMNQLKSAFFRKILPVAVVRHSRQSVSAESVFFAKTKLDAVWESMLDLPLKHREVLMLEIKYELSIADIADFLGIAEGTVKSRLHRAKAQMRKKWKEEE